MAHSRKAEPGVYLDPRGAINDPRNVCPYCLAELARGTAADGKCGHEDLLQELAREQGYE